MNFAGSKHRIADIDDISSYSDLLEADGNSVANKRLCDDLDISELFRYIDRCISSVGEMKLYYRLRNAMNCNSIKSKESVISDLDDDTSLRSKVEKALLNISDIDCHTICNILNTSAPTSRWRSYIIFLPVIEISLVLLSFFSVSPIVSLILGMMFFVLNIVVHYRNKSFTITYIMPILSLRKIRDTAISLAAVDMDVQKEKIKESSEKINHIVKLTNMMNANMVLESDWFILLYLFMELVKIIFLLEPLISNSILSDLNDNRKHIRNIIEYIGDWDLLYSISSFRKWMENNKLEYTTPVIDNTQKCLKIDNLYHPLIQDCVPNSILIDNSVVITGSNMSGKSSFIKAIGVNIVTGYAIDTVFASAFHMPKCRVYTSINLSDDITAGKSYYLTEVTEMKSIIDNCDNPDNYNLVLIDEIFKGTNTIERIAIANAVILYLAEKDNTSVVVSTHDIELARSFTTDKIDVFHFSEEFTDGKLKYDYKLNPGIEYKRNAISILRQCKYPEDIIYSAENNVSRIMVDHFTI